MQVKVFVTPRKGILDPQGRAVEHSLRSLGFHNVGNVKIGRYITLEIDAASADEARAEAGKMCEQLLANPLIEDFSFEVDGNPGQQPPKPSDKQSARSGNPGEAVKK